MRRAASRSADASGVTLPRCQPCANVRGLLEVLAPRTVGFQVVLGGVAGLVVEQGEGDGAQHRLGMAPADGVAGCARRWRRRWPCGRCRGSRGRRSAPEQLEDLVGPRRAHQAGDGPVGGLHVPGVHRLDEVLAGAVGRRQLALLQRPASSTAPFFFLTSCEFLKSFMRPEQRQPAVGVRRGQRRQVGGVDGQHAVELEADRPRLDVAHAGQEDGGEQTLIAGRRRGFWRPPRRAISPAACPR